MPVGPRGRGGFSVGKKGERKFLERVHHFKILQMLIMANKWM